MGGRGEQRQHPREIVRGKMLIGRADRWIETRATLIEICRESIRDRIKMSETLNLLHLYIGGTISYNGDVVLYVFLVESEYRLFLFVYEQSIQRMDLSQII